MHAKVVAIGSAICLAAALATSLLVPARNSPLDVVAGAGLPYIAGDEQTGKPGHKASR